MSDTRPSIKFGPENIHVKIRLQKYAASLGISIPEAIDTLLKIVNK